MNTPDKIQEEIDWYVIEARRLRKQEEEHKKWSQITHKGAEECDLCVKALELKKEVVVGL